jgi:penicillin-binding protein 1A
VPLPLRFLLVVLVSGAGLALGVGLLAPEVRTVMHAGKVGNEENLVELTELSQRTEVYARDGSLKAVLHAEENRQPVSLSAVPEHVQNAILDVEDDRFWLHRGVDLRSTVRALRTNVNAGGVRQGGSTITQQLVKNALLTPERSVNRKVREAVLALRLENKLSKKEILERYLNTVYFGNGSYGVQAAAETYFNTDVGNLTEAQAAMLAGIIRNPEGYDPIKHPDAARTRRDVAVSRMVANHHLDAAQARSIKEDPLPLKVSAPLPEANDYFVEEVKQRLLDDKRLGETPQERYNALFKGGLKITTTLDPRMQDAAEQKVTQILPDTKGKFTAALVTVEPGTGYVRAMVAGKDFNNTKYNLATARGGSGRQPGSSFKPFVLLTALERGYSPNDTIDGTTPCTLKVPGFAPYDVENYEGEGGGILSLTDATVHSVNCAYVRLGAVAGLDKVVDMADRLGIPKERLKPYPSISLGAQEVSPLEMASAYAAIANDGVYHAPHFVEKVVDRHGKVLFEGTDKGKKVTDPQYTREAIQVMRQVVQRGTGVRARLAGRQVAGKTGTSQNHENAWFVGFTPQLATAVWMGAPAGNIPMKNVGGIRVAGGTYPARIFGAYMEVALEGAPALDFPLPNPKLIPRGKFINDKFSAHKVPTTSTSTTLPVDATLPPETTLPPTPETTPTTKPPPATTTTKPPTTTTSTTEKPAGGGKP